MAPYVGPSTPAHVRLLLQKIDDADPDIRFMTLNDLFNTLSHGSPLFMSSDHKIEDDLGEKVLRKLDDQNGDVQNQAIKWCVRRRNNSSCDTDPFNVVLECLHRKFRRRGKCRCLENS